MPRFNAILAVANVPNANGDVFTEELLRGAASERNDLLYNANTRQLLYVGEQDEMSVASLPANESAVILPPTAASDKLTDRRNS